MTTAIAGQPATLLVEWRQYAGGPMSTMTGVSVAITNLATGATVLANTSTGVATVATGINSYTWTPLANLASGEYLATWTGTDPEAETVVATEVVTVAKDPAGAYTTLEAVKVQLGKITTDDRDSAISASILTASRMIDSETGRWPGAYLPASVATARVFNRLGRVWVLDTARSAFRVDEIGVGSGIIVESGYVASGVYSTLASYGTGPDNAIAVGDPIQYITAGYSSFSGIDSMRVTARWGWPALPVQIEMATRMMAARLYRRKDSPQGVINVPEFGGMRVSRFDPDVRALLGPYMIPGFA